ncbi:hypothetical protein CPS_2076 [Colwellia psychrerythraea 34H]|uniref:Uncharacterized protein n=1 Tax=Colwellia psychrerythraea (strain 34H / ATCC BAA-681) TaxID=167879 RepID=Q483G4_COLP3|nr:hypothetical protein CPS_2076 [Colwellia psychrerythraea 34H]
MILGVGNIENQALAKANYNVILGSEHAYCEA